MQIPAAMRYIRTKWLRKNHCSD